MTATENVKAATTNAVIASWCGKKQSDIYGLTFFWAKQNYWTGSWSIRDIYLEVTWGQVTGWANFLDSYYA